MYIIIIARWMTHPFFLLFIVIVSFLFGEPKFDFWNILIWIFIWLFLNLIYGRNSYLYKLWERKSEKEIIERIAKKHPEQYYKLWGGVEGKVKKNTKKVYKEYLKDKEKKKREKLSQEEKEELDSLKEEQIEKDKKKILKLSREKIKRDIEFLSRLGLIDYQRYWKDHLALHPELKTTQPELYNKILMMCDVAEELKIREKKDSPD